MEPAITSMCPDRGAGSWNISYFSTSAKLRLSTMSTALSSALSGLSSALHSEVPNDAELSQLESLLVQAHQVKFRAEVAAAKAQAEAQFAATQAELAQAQALTQAAAQQAAQAQLQAQLAAAQEAAEARLTAAVTAQIEGLTGGQPATSNQQPATSNQQPAASNQQPAASNPQPAASNPQPAASNPQPAASNPQPNAAKSVNARFANLNAGLNDRLAFVKHLFGGDDQDYQRIVAYLATLESKSECETFIREAVQPEYDWSKSPDVAERFMALVYARFE
jgi:hypothetical protein